MLSHASDSCERKRQRLEDSEINNSPLQHTHTPAHCLMKRCTSATRAHTQTCARILADIQTRSAYRMRDEPSVYVCSETPSLVHSALNYILPRFLWSFSSASIHGTSTTVLLDARTLFSPSFPRIKFYCRMYFSSSHHRIARAHTFPSVHHIACVCVRARVFPVCIVTSCGRESCVCKFESVIALSIDIFSSIWNFASLHRMRYVYGIPEHWALCSVWM